VAIAPTKIVEVKTAPTELTTQIKEIKKIEPVAELVSEKVITKISVAKLPTFKGVGPFTFTLGLTVQGSPNLIKDPVIAIGVKVISQTPKICTVTVKFSQVTSKYTLNVTGVSNGQCKITAIDQGNSDKFPAATQINQSITGVPIRKTVNVKVIKPTPTPKAAITKADYKSNKR
jgi:hypothetical protein